MNVRREVPLYMNGSVLPVISSAKDLSVYFASDLTKLVLSQFHYCAKGVRGCKLHLAVSVPQNCLTLFLVYCKPILAYCSPVSFYFHSVRATEGVYENGIHENF